MKLSNVDLLEELHKRIKEDYPDLTIDQLKEICHTPWLQLKKEMESGELSEVRFKYFGTFKVYPGRARLLLKSMKEKFKNQLIQPREYFKYKSLLEKFLKKEQPNYNVGAAKEASEFTVYNRAWSYINRITLDHHDDFGLI